MVLGWGGREGERTRLDWLLYFGYEDLNFVGDIFFFFTEAKSRWGGRQKPCNSKVQG